MTPEEQVEKDLEAFKTWLDDVPTSPRHYALAESVGWSAIEEYKVGFIQNVAQGMAPKEAGENALLALIALAFTLGYDFAQSGYHLDYCKCDTGHAVDKERLQAQQQPAPRDNSDIPGMYL